MLADWPKLRANAYDRGDYDAMLMLIDLENAMISANLTAKQETALFYVYYEDLTQNAVADLLGTTQENISLLVALAVRNIAKIYGKWAEREH